MKRTNRNSRTVKAATSEDEVFLQIVQLIASARGKAIHAVNTALIDIYWQVGAIISGKIETAGWGDGVVDNLAAFIAKTYPGLRGLPVPIYSE